MRRHNNDRIGEVEKWPKHKGRTQLLAHLHGKQLSSLQAIKAKCYECTGAFDAGMDCQVPDCPLYQFLKAGKWDRPKRAISEAQREAGRRLAAKQREKQVGGDAK